MLTAPTVLPLLRCPNWLLLFRCTVVAKSSLAPFDCSWRGGVRTMDAEPSIVCDGAGPHGRMRAVGVLTLVVFALGLPGAMAAFLFVNMDRVQSDQRLRERGEGDSALTNPNIQVWLLAILGPACVMESCFVHMRVFGVFIEGLALPFVG